MSCLTLALRLLALRDLTEHQLRTRLEARHHASVDIGQVIDKLKADGTLNDERLARTRARAEAERGRKGPHRVRRELEEAGVAAAVAKTAAQEAFADLDPADMLDALLKKRLQGKPLDPPAQRRTYQYLLRRGFEASDVISALRKYSGHEP